jgi:hypothetical protein
MEHEKHITYFIHSISASHVKAKMKLTQQNMERETTNRKMGTEWGEKAIKENNKATGFLHFGVNKISELT